MSTRIVVFDMDGTLVQARAAAWEVFQDTAREFELPIRSAEEFFGLFDDSFLASLDAVCADPELAARVRDHFMTALRERYTPKLIPGMSDVIKRLAPHYALAVMSSNAMQAIRRTLDAAGVASCFAHVFAADLELSKHDQLTRLASDPSYGNVRRCSDSYVESGQTLTGEDVVLVTDTVGDVKEAVAAGVGAIGVSWGMHSGERLIAAGAGFVARWPQELIAELLPAGSCRPGGCGCESGSCHTTGSCTIPDPVMNTAPGGPRSTDQVIAAASVRFSRRLTPAGQAPLPPVPRRDHRRDRGGYDPALRAAISRISPQ